MKPEFSRHALEQMGRRGIPEAMVLKTIAAPDTITEQGSDILIYSKLEKEGTKYYFYRIFVNHLKEPVLVVTAYKTSKTKKYGY